jgi:hypothetical protein
VVEMSNKKEDKFKNKTTNRRKRKTNLTNRKVINKQINKQRKLEINAKIQHAVC